MYMKCWRCHLAQHQDVEVYSNIWGLHQNQDQRSPTQHQDEMYMYTKTSQNQDQRKFGKLNKFKYWCLHLRDQILFHHVKYLGGEVPLTNSKH